MLSTCGALAQPGGPAVVIAARLVERTVAAKQSFVGSIEPTKRATIGSAVSGRVTEFPVEAGDRVEKGEKLAQLLTATISLELAAAEAELEYRRQMLAELENGSRPEEVEQARARMAAANSRFEFATARRDRVQRVFLENRAVTDDEVGEAVSLAAEAEEAYAEAKAAHSLLVAGPREEVIAQSRAQVKIQEAVVERLRDQLAKYTIITRFAGYVVTEHTEIGAWVSSGDPVAEVVAVDRVEAVAQVSMQSVNYLRPGERVEINIPALEGRSFEGVVVTTVPQGDLRSRTFPVKVLLENEINDAGPLLKPGMIAHAVLPTGAPRTVLLAPKDAVVLDQSRRSMFVVDKASGEGQTGAVSLVPVTLGVASGPWIEVLGGVSAGQLVVVQGNERLRPGQEVKVSRVVDDPLAAAAKPSVSPVSSR
ncbi:efflux RND transporter periplasmic adaptor subunit [Pseudobythopirellula maris]|uniref:efflux RND transporter periplasmic adaptor subunit n=1 Tax=Pseudobythopirellula maris TaxID=2527991 RepID=UPI0018D3AA4D|nr:efflux RND transporter periplasmic adaptor subunit [Pseudobythopirellula maris]